MIQKGGDHDEKRLLTLSLFTCFCVTAIAFVAQETPDLSKDHWPYAAGIDKRRSD